MRRDWLDWGILLRDWEWLQGHQWALFLVPNRHHCYDHFYSGKETLDHRLHKKELKKKDKNKYKKIYKNIANLSVTAKLRIINILKEKNILKRKASLKGMEALINYSIFITKTLSSLLISLTSLWDIFIAFCPKCKYHCKPEIAMYGVNGEKHSDIGISHSRSADCNNNRVYHGSFDLKRKISLSTWYVSSTAGQLIVNMNAINRLPPRQQYCR